MVGILKIYSLINFQIYSYSIITITMVHIIFTGFIDFPSGNFYLCRTFTYFADLPIPASVNHQSICIYEFDIFILDCTYKGDHRVFNFLSDLFYLV